MESISLWHLPHCSSDIYLTVIIKFTSLFHWHLPHCSSGIFLTVPVASTSLFQWHLHHCSSVIHLTLTFTSLFQLHLPHLFSCIYLTLLVAFNSLFSGIYLTILMESTNLTPLVPVHQPNHCHSSIYILFPLLIFSIQSFNLSHFFSWQSLALHLSFHWYYLSLQLLQWHLPLKNTHYDRTYYWKRNIIIILVL